MYRWSSCYFYFHNFFLNLKLFQNVKDKRKPLIKTGIYNSISFILRKGRNRKSQRGKWQRKRTGQKREERNGYRGRKAWKVVGETRWLTPLDCRVLIISTAAG